VRMLCIAEREWVRDNLLFIVRAYLPYPISTVRVALFLAMLPTFESKQARV
jgi:hypothetical protein